MHRELPEYAERQNRSNRAKLAKDVPKAITPKLFFLKKRYNFTSRAKITKASAEPSRVAAKVARGCSAQTEVQTLQPPQSKQLLSRSKQPRQREEMDDRMRKSTSRFHKWSRARQESRPDSPAEPLKPQNFPEKAKTKFQIWHPSNGSRNEQPSPSIPLSHTAHPPRPNPREERFAGSNHAAKK